ncbi:MAG: carboxymuconolactone decarboxylase family protein [Eubacteriales bacterium]|nr:carboxymuconolactone decarboxylase family protein [Eubacteriales bacterium]NLO35623.1 carboxymuconolactone decarboxylase family protein [Clostridiaceae bacterium]
MQTGMGHRLYSLGEIYVILVDGMRTMPHLARARRRHVLLPQTIERVMLAVTEVNGCAVCSYAHAKMALETGMSHEEIREMLAGDLSGVLEDALEAVLFAQHYADSRGKVSHQAWHTLTGHAGQVKAYGILGAARAIMIGNVLGIPWGSFFNRLRGRPDTRSALGYEIAVMLLGSLLMLPATVHALIAGLCRKPLLTCTDR